MGAGPIRYVDCDGLQLAYQVVGEGPVDVLYVPGNANHIEAMWDIPEMARFTERLAGFARLILVDKRGTGLSDPMPNDQRATIEERVRDVWAVLDEVGSETTILFATADGTPVGMMAAAARPDRVAALVLYASSPRLMADDGLRRSGRGDRRAAAGRLPTDLGQPRRRHRHRVRRAQRCS